MINFNYLDVRPCRTKRPKTHSTPQKRVNLLDVSDVFKYISGEEFKAAFAGDRQGGSYPRRGRGKWKGCLQEVLGENL